LISEIYKLAIDPPNTDFGAEIGLQAHFNKASLNIPFTKVSLNNLNSLYASVENKKVTTRKTEKKMRKK
jgi:hypothetical protein